MATFDELVAEALNAPFSGWDFSWLAARSTAGTLSWSYRDELTRRAAADGTLLDMGTGGDERLAQLSPRPRRTVATEAWPPNVAVAAARLRPQGIPVIQDEGAPDNTSQEGDDRGRLPFRDGVFTMVTSRHEAFQAAEVSRVLAPGGTFITQQVDFHSNDDLCELLGLKVPPQPESWLPLAAAGRTPMGCCASTFPGTPTSGRSRSETSMPSPLNSTTALDKRSGGSHHVRHWTRRCDDRLRQRGDLRAAATTPLGA